MIHRRIVYALVLAAALLFQITNDNYLGFFLLALVLLLPVLSLILSLPGMTGCRLALAAQPAILPRGQEGNWLLSARNRTGLPLSRITVRLEIWDLLSGTCRKESRVFSGVASRKPVRRPADTAHCGAQEYRVTRARVWDYLGLFSLPSRLPEPAHLLVEPVPIAPDPIHIPDGQGVRPSADTAARRGRGEDYDLREYRPGDAMRSVHWKLSSKRDELIVREPADTLTPLPLITFDHREPLEQLDETLDRLTGYSRAMLAVQQPHAILWLSPKGTPVRRDVCDEKDLRDCLLAILSQRAAPADAPSIAERDDLLPGERGPVFRIHVAPGEDGGHG